MNAELRALESPDAPDGNLHAFKPEDVESFGLGFTATTGPAGERRGELFQCLVCLGVRGLSAGELTASSAQAGELAARSGSLAGRGDMLVPTSMGA
jgi:hypothetical protein